MADLSEEAGEWVGRWYHSLCLGHVARYLEKVISTYINIIYYDRQLKTSVVDTDLVDPLLFGLLDTDPRVR